MTTPRTVAGQAALSGMRPHVKRALGQTIVAIETEAVAPYVEALREADGVLEDLASWDAKPAGDASSKADIVRRAEAAHRHVQAVLTPHVSEPLG